MKKFYSGCMAVACLLVCETAFSYDIEFGEKVWYANGVESGGYDAKSNQPLGWNAVSDFEGFFIMPDKTGPEKSRKSSLKFNVCNAVNNQTGDVTMGIDVCVPREEIVCDNISAKLMLYVYPRQNKNVDTIQLIVTTNDWKNAIEIGKPIPIRDSRYTEGWKELPVVGSVKGISQLKADTAFRVGFRVKAGGDSQVYGYLHGLSLKFVACATPDKPVLVSSISDSPDFDLPLQSPIVPGMERGRMAVKVNVSPEEKVGDLTVWGVLSRKNGTVPPVTNQLVKSGDVYYEKVEDVLSRRYFDAGEAVSVSVFTKYKSKDPNVSTLGDIKDGFAQESSASTTYNVGKSGSVWINEIGVVGDKCLVELCGTTNRSFRTGWQIILSGDGKAYTNNLLTAFDFATNMVNGVVGIEAYRWAELDDVVLKNATLELRNSAGVVEFSQTGISSFPAHYQMNGKAKWHGVTDEDWSYDWTGTATDGTFAFELSAVPASFGLVNNGQGFLAPVGTMLYFTTLIRSNDLLSPLSYANITAIADGILNGKEGSASFNGQTDEGTGTAKIKITGYSDDASRVPLNVSVSAFGWKCEHGDVKTNISLYGASVCLTNVVTSTIAFDDFSKLSDYWRNESAIRHTKDKTLINWSVADNCVQLDTRKADVGDATLTTKGYIAPQGKRFLDISFDFRNEDNTGTLAECVKLSIVVSDTADFKGIKLTTSAVANKSKSYGLGEWYSVREFLEAPEGFAKDGKIWIRVKASVDNMDPGVVTRLDNLRVATVDSVKVNSFKLEPPTGMEFPMGTGSDVELDISPLTAGLVSNYVNNVLINVETNFVKKVAADLVLTINDTEFVVPFSFMDGSLTNDISAVEGNVKLRILPAIIIQKTGGFLPGDVVKYYAQVTYVPNEAIDSGMRDVRYYPDNVKKTAENGWRVENGYRFRVQSLTIPDQPALTLVGKPETTADGVRFTVHGYSANKLSEVSIYTNGVKCAEQPFAYLGTNNQIRVTGEFVIETGLNASTTYTVTIKGKDGTGAELQEATFTFLTKPKEPVIMGVPKKGAYSPTKAFDFYALAEADDVANLNFHWLLDETATKTGNGETNYTDNVEADGPHTVRVYVTDQESNVSSTNSLSWVVDTTKPTPPEIAGTPANGSVTNGVAYDLTAESTDANLDAFYWILDGAAGVRALPEEAFKDNVAEGFGTHVVKCYAVDKAGWVSETNDWVWTVDTVAPTNLTFKGWPADGTVTKDPKYRLMATALDDMACTYHWLLEDGTEETTAEGAYLDRDVGEDGRHAVRYYATDKAGNSSVTNTLSWTVDRKAPTGVKILGAPVGDPAVTNEPTLSLSAVADKDLTTITYHWLTNGVAAVTATNFEVTVTRDGAFTVSCYATDEAQNVSETNSVSWVLDTDAPTVPVLTDVLENGVVTSNKAYTFSATATDLTRIDFTWVLSGGEAGTPTRDGAVTGEQTGGYYGNVKADGVYTITVYAKDAAGNGPVSTNWTWTVDTTPPRIIGMDATPDEGDVVATNGFDFTVFMKDATELTYRWVLNGVTNGTCTTSNYVDTAAIEGTNTVSVFAEDAAHNVCEPTNLTWVVDLHSPTNVTIHGWPMGKGAVITNGTDFAFTATAEDDTALRFFWSLNGGTEIDKAVFSSEDATVREETNTVSVYAKDEAGNVSETSSWSWIVDTTPPVIRNLTGKPDNGALTNDPTFDFKVLATDKTAITYYWTTNDFAVTDNFASNLVGRAIEGTNTVSVYVEDAAHNFSVTTNTVRWTLDMIHPTVKLSTETDEKHIINATNDFFVTATFSEPVTNFTAKSVSVDNGSVVSIATNVEANVYVVKIAPKDDGPISVQIAANAVTDLAGNGNEPSTNDRDEQAPLTRTCDITPPGVSLTSSTPTYFNRKVGYMTVTVSFTEPVVGFTKDSLTVVTGQTSWEVVSNEANTVFTLRVWPNKYPDEEFIGQEKITVNVLAEVVTDAAGNPNTAAVADLTKTYDTLTPTVDITSENVPDPARYFNEDKKPLLVKIVVSGSNVTELASSSVVVTNGTFTFDHTEAQEKQDIYKLKVTPLSNGVVTVVVPAGVVTNASQNVNEQPEPLVRIYDSEAPTGIRIDGKPETNKVVATTRFIFDASAQDNLMQPHELEYHWTLNDEPRDDKSSHYEGDVPKGTNWVSVYATDAAGNSCKPVRRTWVVDYLNPTNLVLTGTPALEDRIVVTTETNFNFVATAEDETRISYLWTTNGADVADNLTTNLTGIAIEGTNVVTVTAMDEASNRWEYGEKVLTRTWVVDTLAPSNLAFVACTPKAGAVVATNGFSFTASAQDATRLTYHWILNGVTNQTCTSANFVGTTALEGTNTVSVYAEDEAHNLSAATNLTWVVDRTDPTGLTLSGTPTMDNIITNKPGFAFKAKATDKTRLTYHWTLNDAEVKGNTSSDFHGNGREGTNTVSVYAMDEASNTCAAVSRIWIVDTLAPTNLVVTGAPENGVVTKSADFAFGATAEDATAITYHWKTNDVDYVFADGEPTTNIVGTVIEGTNTVQIWAEDAAHNVCDPTQIVWVVDWTKPGLPDIKGSPARGAITNGTEHSFTATAEDKTLLTYYWTFNDAKDVEKEPGVPFTEGTVDEGTNTVYVYAIDEAGNVSPTNSLSWIVDRIAPKMPVIVDASPASNSFVNVTNYNFTAAEPEGEEDATAVKFFWRIEGGDLDGKKEDPVTNFTGEVGMDGAYTAFVYAKDAAGNISPTNSLSWTVDTVPPVLGGISGTPAAGDFTNVSNYSFTVSLKFDDATPVTNYWRIGEAGVEVAVSNFTGAVVTDGVYTVFVYAKDAAGNVSQTTNSLSWTYDATPPQGLKIGGTPTTNRFVVATDDFDFTASYEYDLTSVSYNWTLNGAQGSMTSAFGGQVSDGTNTVTVFAIDKACNTSTVSRTWVADTLPPTNRIVFAMPGNGEDVITNKTFFSITALAEDATTQVAYCWTTNDVAVLDKTVTTNLTSWLAREGTNTVTVYAKDEAGNVSETNTVTWTVDLTPPTVTLSTETLEDHVINRTDVFKVTVSFSESVVGFTTNSVTVSNGTVTNVAAVGKTAYDVWIAPTHDGDITVQVEVNKVMDLAGNGNLASEMLMRTCDITPPTVTRIESDWSYFPFGQVDLDWSDNTFAVTVEFSEPVTNFTKSSVTVTNGTVVSVMETGEMTYELKVRPIDLKGEYAISVLIAEDATTDRAGNGNRASDTLTCVYDSQEPTTPGISGTPANGSTTSDPNVKLVVSTPSTDLTDVTYFWELYDANGEWIDEVTGTNLTYVITEAGEYNVEVFAEDGAGNQSEYVYWCWTFDPSGPSGGVTFGDSVQLKISTPEVTNVVFTAVDFHPGADSTFALREFELIDSQDTAKEITDLRMQFIVGTNLLDGIRWPVEVENFAGYTNGTLTVRILGDKTTDEATGKPYEELFIFGIDNQNLDK